MLYSAYRAKSQIRRQHSRVSGFLRINNNQKRDKKGQSMNLNGRMKKLQTAIVKAGLIIKVNSNQFYSADQKRMITSYRICTPIDYYSAKKEEWKTMDYEILRTCSMPEVIFCLLDIYKAVTAWN